MEPEEIEADYDSDMETANPNDVGYQKIEEELKPEEEIAVDRNLEIAAKQAQAAKLLEVTVIEDKRLNIDWIRHAQSCANIAPFKISAPQQKLKAHTIYQPNLTFFGLQQSIALGATYSKDQDYDIVFASPLFRTITTALMSLRMKPNAVIYVVPYISEVQHTELNIATTDVPNRAVPSDVLKRSVLFIKEWLEHSWIKYFSDIELFQTLEEMMTIAHPNDPNRPFVHPDDKIFIDAKSIIENQCKDSKDSKDGKDGSCQNEEKLRAIIQSLLDGLKTGLGSRQSYHQQGAPIQPSTEETNKINEYISRFEQFLNKKFIRGPRVDFSIYDYFIKTKGADELYGALPSFEKFYLEVLPFVFNRAETYLPNPQKKEINMACYSHGAIIRGEMKRIYFKEHGKDVVFGHVQNTEVFKEERESYKRGTIVRRGAYKPDDSIDSTYDSFKKIKEPADPNKKSMYTAMKNVLRSYRDLCRSEGLKGMLNRTIWKNMPRTAKTMQSLSYKKGSWVPFSSYMFGVWNEKDYTDPDCKFYYEDGYDKTKYDDNQIKVNILENRGILGGGHNPTPSPYYAKYIKYKTKYMQLKNSQA